MADRRIAKQSPTGSAKSINIWQKLFSRSAKVVKEVYAQADEIRRLKRDLARVTEERDILKSRHGSQRTCARYKQPVLPSVVWWAVADRLLEGQTPLKSVAHGLMRT